MTVRGATLQPAVGAFLGGFVTTSVPSDRPFTLRADTRTSRGESAAGMTVGLPVLVKAGAVDLALGPDIVVDLARDRVGGGLRVRANF